MSGHDCETDLAAYVPFRVQESNFGPGTFSKRSGNDHSLLLESIYHLRQYCTHRMRTSSPFG